MYSSFSCCFVVKCKAQVLSEFCCRFPSEPTVSAFQPLRLRVRAVGIAGQEVDLSVSSNTFAFSELHNSVVYTAGGPRLLLDRGTLEPGRFVPWLYFFLVCPVYLSI